MEALVRPFEDWGEWPESIRGTFQEFRTPEGEKMILEDNVFVERILPRGVHRKLTDEEMAEYRRPFEESGESRLPTLRWPRQLPIAGEPADVTAICASYAEWLSRSAKLPKLFINVEPGAILSGKPRDFCRSWPNQRELTLPGSHFVQEDSGPRIGVAIAEWLNNIN